MRLVRKARVVLLAVAVFVDLPATAAEQARGVVFEDLNGDGLRDAGEPGLADVAVSNGRDVVVTDAEGRYRLSVEDGTILFVTKPAGFSVPLSDENLPRFYYVHAPTGTPAELDLRYAGLEPTGPLPESVDFPLTRTPEPDEFTVVWLADPQPQTGAEVDFFRDDVASELVGIDAAFGMTVGDIMYDELALYPRYNRIVGQIGIPWYNVPGNHDLNYLSPDDRYSLETFKRNFGPGYYSFDYGKAHFVGIDDVHYLGSNVGIDEPHERGAGRYRGRIDDVQLEWLAHDLQHVAPEKLVVLGMHIPLRSSDFSEHPERNVANREALFRLIEKREHVVVVAGHMHVTEHHYFGPDDGYRGAKPLHQHSLSAACGSWWAGPIDERGIPTSWQRDGTPNGYYLMDVDGTSYKLRFKAAGEAAERQLQIMLDSWYYQYSASPRRDYRMGQMSRGAIALDQVHSTDVVVNLFDGGPKSTVEFRIGERPAVRMKRISRTDPFIVELYQRHRDEMKKWIRITPSTHVWVADLPRDLEPGAHTIEVRAVDEYGQEHSGRQVIEVLAP